MRTFISTAVIVCICISISGTYYSQDAATLEAPSEVNAGSEFSVYWTGPDSRGDMVTIVETGAEEGEYGSYTYTKRSKKDRDGKSEQISGLETEPGKYREDTLEAYINY